MAKPGKAEKSKTEEPSEPKKKSKLGFVGTTVAISLAFGILGVGVWSFIAFPELLGGDEEEEEEEVIDLAALTEAERQAYKEKLMADAESSATVENHHCKFLHTYYKGSKAEEFNLPFAQLVGMPPDTPEEDLWQRCEDLFKTVKRTGGWPGSRQRTDNFVICTGFEYNMGGSFKMTVTPTPESLAKNRVLVSTHGRKPKTLKVNTEYPIKILRNLLPRIIQADDRCVVIAVDRVTGNIKPVGHIARSPLALPPETPIVKEGGYIPLRHLAIVKENRQRKAKGLPPLPMPEPKDGKKAENKEDGEKKKEGDERKE